MRSRLLLAVAALAALAPSPAAARSAEGTGARAPTQRGVTLTAWWHDHYGRPAAAEELTAIAATGSTHVTLIATWYMPSRTSSTLAPKPEKTPSDASLLAAMATARSLGLGVVLKPHVDVDDGSFRGAIRPGDVAAWFAAYRAMVEHYAGLARTGGASVFVVGTELTTMSRHEREFRTVIAAARARFRGRVTFAANMIAGAKRVRFWDALDYIGVDAYMPLSAEASPTTAELVRAWHARGYVAELRRLHLRYGKPVLFTEIGYEARAGTAARPSGGADGLPDPEAQRRAYEAALRTWWNVRWFAGLHWWEWRAWREEGENGSFSPARRAAEQTIRLWNARSRPPR